MENNGGSYIPTTNYQLPTMLMVAPMRSEFTAMSIMTVVMMTSTMVVIIAVMMPIWFVVTMTTVISIG